MSGYIITGRPTHVFRPAWTDPATGQGHDCIDCPENSPFRCDDLTHPADTPTEFTRP
jgi:hypothetical protein